MITDIMRRTILGKKEKFLFEGYREGMIDFDSIGSEIGLYIHIPFCKEICSYCPYNKTIYKRGMAGKYKKAIIHEIKLYSKILKDKSITSVYIGGGTPTLMADDLKEILELIKKTFRFSGNIGIEAHPAEAKDELFDSLEDIGVNLISLGVQTFNDKILDFLGRGYSSGEADKALSIIKQYGFKCIDVDIMTNLPGQTMEDIEYDISRAYSYDIDQLSVYPLIVFPMTKMGTAIRENELNRFNGLQEKKILGLIDEISRKNGYKRSSVWTYGKDGGSRYTSVTRESFVGLGAGASSLAGGYFYLNTFSVEEYIKALEHGGLPINLVNRMSEKERMIFWIFWRCYDGVIDGERFARLYNADLVKEFPLLFAMLKALGMTKVHDGRFELTEWGRYAYHLVEKQYSVSYLNDLWHASMKQPWIEEIRL
ncbi:MAG: coproporphyrinogen-III oxidase family protein [Bacillota bacterium]|nr:coproporphyrinogen-III oxidase family protein [Bacillota bacterium]MDD3298550.1 coproporphyrinogen-III oxidase family protein [Bacillota bacterium]MDD3850001.1 coproporphyrinogen-III oxidase family protein [Bacillota bacterium]MDD4706762.1 coproporphyrinogen-III oxidase family protein [Bacillota bacterium]